jgi:hypothetical protein
MRPLGDELHRVAELNREHRPPEGLEDMNPKYCTHFTANEMGNCKNLHWCFRVFGINLQCQAVSKPEELPKEESRRLEVI